MASDKEQMLAPLSLKRIQEFKVESLARESELGSQLSFREIVPTAQEIIGLYNRVPTSILSDFSDNHLNIVISLADSDFNLFGQVLSFNPTDSNAAQLRASLISQIKARRDQLFDQIWHYISYGVARNTDTNLLETQGRATIQAIKDQSKDLTDQLEQSKTEANAALVAIRAVASEQGVSQQAAYFRQEAIDQEALAADWLKRTYWLAWALGVFAVLSLFIHKFDWIRPVSNIDLIQMMSSKVLVFAVLAFMLVHAARNFGSSKHNAVINRHRQNALLTYKALVAASGENGTQDIVLAHAAACIFAPQTTGFSSTGNDMQSGPKSVLELMTKGSNKSSDS
jgi:hypothetical protein